MFKFLKMLLKIILIVVVLIVLLVGVLALVIDPNSYKPQIEKLVLEKTGMSLALPGKLSWSFWPILGMKTTALSLNRSADSVVQGGSPQSLVSIENPEFGVDLLAWSFSLQAASVTASDFVIQNFYLNARQISFSSKQSIPLHLKGQVSRGLPLPLDFDLKSQFIFDSVLDRQGAVGPEDVLMLKDIQLQLNQSDFSGQIKIQSFTKPLIQVDLASPEIHVSDFVDLKGKKLDLNEVALTSSLNLDLRNSAIDPVSTLEGTVDFSVNNALLKGVNVGSLLGTLRNTFSGLLGSNNSGSDPSNASNASNALNIPNLVSALGSASAPSGWLTSGDVGSSSGQDQTKIGSVSFNAQIQNGVTEAANLLVNGDRFQAKGAGVIDLVQQKIDYKISVYGMTNNVPDQYVIPFQINGSLQNPRMGIDYAVLNAQLRDVIQEKAKSSLIQKISDSVPNLGSQLQGVVGSLLGGG